MAAELIAASAAAEAIKSSITTITEDHPGQNPAMGSSQPPGPALVAAATDADPVTHLVLAWLSARRSENTRAAYARDIGITPQRRPGRAPSWLAWCQQQEVHPVTGVTGLHVARYARQLDAHRTIRRPARPASSPPSPAGTRGWPGAGISPPAPPPASPGPAPARTPPPRPALTQDQALALIHAADTAPGPQRARTAALIAVLLFTGARLSEVTGADVADLGTSGGRRVLWVTRADGRRHGLPLPGPAASRIDAYLASRPGEAGDQALFATRTGRRLFAADVRHTLRRLATRAGPARPTRPATWDRGRSASPSPRCTSRPERPLASIAARGTQAHEPPSDPARPGIQIHHYGPEAGLTAAPAALNTPPGTPGLACHP